MNKKRAPSEIALEVAALWPKVAPSARPYLDAMGTLSKVTDTYYLDSGREIILRFLCNATSWRGPDARRIKQELKELLS